MLVLRQACRTAAAIMIPLAFLSCRDTAGPTGTGRLAPTAAALAVAPTLDDGDPDIPLRQARIRLFRLPWEASDAAVVDTLIPFGDREEQTVTVRVTVTTENERLGLELALLDDREDVAYVGRDTVVAHTTGKPPAPKAIRLVYAGPDTAVTRIVVEPRDTVLAMGDAFPIRASAFLRDGRPTSARFGFAVHGAPAVTVDAAGFVRARAPAGRRETWVVARTATGLTDSIAVEVLRASDGRDLVP